MNSTYYNSSISLKQNVFAGVHKKRTIPFRAILSITILLFLISILSCKKLVDISPPADQIADDNVYTTDGTAIAVLTGLYTDMSKPGIFAGIGSISLLTGLSADELTLYNGVTSPSYIGYYTNTLAISTAIGSDFWGPLYNYIYKCNAALAGLNASNSLTPLVKQQLMGEATFLRAFYNFYLVNLFGDIPLPTTTDYQANSQLARTPVSQVYQKIITDLKSAQGMLNNDYLDGNLQPYTGDQERVRPTSWAATALLARAYLYNGDYANAEAQATTLINHSSLYYLPSLSDAFLMNSTEAIWQLQPVLVGHNTEDGWTFILPSSGPSDGDNGNPVYLSTAQLNSFETDDQRKISWIDSVTVTGTTYYFPHKYKSATLFAPLTEYLMVLRLSEQYLIRAEARAQQGNVSGAESDLNAIRARAGLPNTTANDKASLLTACLRERRVELYTEWGHRWLDLKRTRNIDAIMNITTPLKSNGMQWKSYQQLFPLPLADIQQVPGLTQNPGY